MAIHGGVAGQRREARVSVQVDCFLEQTRDKAEERKASKERCD